MALIIGLVFLLALTLLGIAVGQIAIQQQRMAANMLESKRAFGEAEQVLREIESRLEADGDDRSFVAQAPVASVVETGASDSDCADAWHLDWAATIARDDAETCAGEACFQLLRFFHQDGEDVAAWPCLPAIDPNEENYYLVTARGPAADGRAEAVVQSVYGARPEPVANPGESIITRLEDGRTVAVAGNGLEDPPTQARLTLTEAATGQLISELVLAEDTDRPQGLFAPQVWLHGSTRVHAERIYAGDLQGNLWRVDVGEHGALRARFGADPLFKAAPDQPIIMRPALAVHPGGGVMVYFGSGQCLEPDDLPDAAAQHFYAVRDRNYPVSRGALVSPGGTAHDGWYTSLTAPGERVLHAARVVAGRVVFTTFEPAAERCDDGTQRLYVTDAIDGDDRLEPAGPVVVGNGIPVAPELELVRPEFGWDAELRFVHPETGHDVLAGRVREGRQAWRQIQ